MNDAATQAWAARRALFEEDGAEPGRIAKACGLRARTVEASIRREGWRQASPRKVGGTTGERLARLYERQLNRAEQAQTRMEASDTFDQKTIAEFASATRSLAKLCELTRDDDRAKDEDMARDADIAAILDKLDRRIVELAGYLAERLAGTKPDAGTGDRGLA